MFEAAGSTGPDADAIAGSIPALSLTAERRYLLADGIDRWKAAQVEALVAALAAMPPDVTVVLIARGSPPEGAGRRGRGRGRRVPRLSGAEEARAARLARRPRRGSAASTSPRRPPGR